MLLNTSKRHERKVKVPDISTKEVVERFMHSLSIAFNSKRIEDRGQYVVCHSKIDLEDENKLDVIVYTSDTIFISASPSLSADVFNKTATKIANIAQQSVKKLADERPLTLQRVESILEFASKLDLDNEFQRMVIVILADTSNEIVLRERLKALRIKGDPLDEGIPQKIERLKQKGIVVHNEKEIRNIRELRNGIVHYGLIPDKAQAKKALDIALDVLKKA